MTSPVNEADAIIEAHTRKITTFEWHPTVESLLVSASVDSTVKLWDVTGSGEPSLTIDNIGGNVLNMQWSQMGNILGATTKSPDELVIMDPRAEDSILRGPTALISRGCKLQWVDEDTILMTGFNQNNARAWSIVDLRNPSAPLGTGTLNPGVNNCFPYFDQTLGYFVLAGRGD